MVLYLLHMFAISKEEYIGRHIVVATLNTRLLGESYS